MPDNPPLPPPANPQPEAAPCCAPGGCCGPSSPPPSPSSCSDPSPDPGLDRREFFRLAGLGAAAFAALGGGSASAQGPTPDIPSPAIDDLLLARFDGSDWPVLRRYPQSHTGRIALPLGGIGTGTVSLGGRGQLHDWEVMNRAAKGFTPDRDGVAPFFALFAETPGLPPVTRVLEGPIEFYDYEASHGSVEPNHNLPRFRHCAFGAAYPLGQVMLHDPDVPLEVRIRGFNPLIPCDPTESGIPLAILRFELHNPGPAPVRASVCASIPNFIGVDGREVVRNWHGRFVPVGAKNNVNRWRESGPLRGIFMETKGVERASEQWGTLALATTSPGPVTHRLDWNVGGWGTPLLDFWDDFSRDGRLEPREHQAPNIPMASLAIEAEIPPGERREIEFLIAWHFPNRQTWTPHADFDKTIGNFYTGLWHDAWHVIESIPEKLPGLEALTVRFVRSLAESSLPAEVREAALFNLSTLRSQTCFRTPDGRFYGWEGICDTQGCCAGSCTHVWNYEQATAFLFGPLARTMREVEFAHATDRDGLMSFRVHLPLERAQSHGKAAADGQMGCIMKLYRDWQLSGDDAMLRELWPHARRALEFCWIPGGWDGDRDGVMEGCQHNTMDVEYYGPNPQMGTWYLGALRAAERMARHLGDGRFADECSRLFKNGSRWIDANLFNGEYYIHEVRPPADPSDIAKSLRVGMGAKDPTKPDFQLAEGCLVDQLVGQFMAHVCGLGYLLDPLKIRTTLQSILKYNRREGLFGHFNNMRSFALGAEAGLLMAAYPGRRPEQPFSYFAEIMTGFEYTAAVGMLYEGMEQEGLGCIRDIRARYDGLRRNPFDEAECGHHYARAMASWAAILALTGFHYSAVERTMQFTDREGRHFWSTGDAWGECVIERSAGNLRAELAVHGGRLELLTLRLGQRPAVSPGASGLFLPGDRFAINV